MFILKQCNENVKGNGLLQCRFCKTKIKFQDKDEEGSQVRILKFQNKHVHKASDHKASFVPMLDRWLDTPFESYVDNLSSLFDIDRDTQLRIQDIFYQKFFNWDGIMGKVGMETGMRFRVWIADNQQPNMMLMISPAMREGYQKFGQALCFDIFHEVCAIRRANVYPRYWMKTLFSGFDNNNRFVLFAIGFIAHNSLILYKKTQVIEGIIEEFLDEQGDSPLQTIIASNSQHIQSALERLKKRRNYEWDVLVSWPYKIESIKNQLFDQGY